MKKSICIISFSPIYRDARVLRQIKFLSPHYDLTVIGYGPPHPEWKDKPGVFWRSIDRNDVGVNRGNRSEGSGEGGQSRIGRLKGSPLFRFIRWAFRRVKFLVQYTLMSLGKIHPRVYEIIFWRQVQHAAALKYALEGRFDAYHVNDWEALPVGGEAVRIVPSRVVFDAHEYAPLELENRRYWRFLFPPIITHFIRKYTHLIDASVTVAPLISERYKQEFGFTPVVILNSPEFFPLTDRDLEADQIRLIHHGGAVRDRELDNLIKTLALCDQRFSLHFMLLNNDPGYLSDLKALARKLAPERIVFHDPVPTEEVVKRISEYDMGFYLLPGNSFNNLAALPNKFFDYIVAGLAVCVGPLPSMAEMVKRFGFGCVAPSFDPQEVAGMLNRLTKEQLSKMRAASHELSKEISAEKEMKKLIELYGHVLDAQPRSNGIHRLHWKEQSSPRPGGR